MKKLSLALALLGLSSTAVYAGGIDYQEPEESGVFVVGVEALYVQPHSSDFLYALQTTTDFNNNTTGRVLGVDPDYQFGFHVDVAYAMPGDGPDISLGYTSLSTDDSENKGGISGSLFGVILGGDSGLRINGVGAGVVNAKTSYDYVDVDLLLGKEFVLQNRYHFHPFAGVRYADIDTKDRGLYTLNGRQVGTGTIRNEFDGVGPRAGVDAALEIANGFSFVARAAGSMILGNFDWELSVVNRGGSAVNPGNGVGAARSQTVRNSDEHIVAPEGDYRLGLNYTHEFSPETSFGVELGWTAVHYFDVLDKSNQRAATPAASMSDWGYQGPYLRLQANIA